MRKKSGNVFNEIHFGPGVDRQKIVRLIFSHQMIKTSLQLFNCVFIITFLAGCSYNKQETLYTALNPNHSGIRFANTITENNADTTLISEFAYMGGGVGIGDFNNDGLKDIYFSGNQVSGKLYFPKAHR